MAFCPRPPFQLSAGGAISSHCRRHWLWLAVLIIVGGCSRHRPANPSFSAPQPVGEVTRAGVARTKADLRAAVKQANVVICVIDAARADRVGCYGYPRPTTPTLDRLASEAFVFDNHFAQIPTTKLATVSLLTGLHPDTHLAYGDMTVPPHTFTLEKALKQAGFRTALFSANVFAAPNTGVGSDFDFAATTQGKFGFATGNPEQTPLGVGGPEGSDSRYCPAHVLGLFHDWLRTARAARFFAYIHIMPPHTPYAAPSDMKGLFTGTPPSVWSGAFLFPGIEPRQEKRRRLPLDQWGNLYDANLRWADEGIGELVRALSEEGVLDRTLLIITSDHGEALGEHGYLYHNIGVYDELLRVPLLVRFPGGQAAGRVSALTQQVDVTATVCDLLDIAYPNSVQGRSMLSLMTGESRKTHDHVFARAMGETPAYLVRTEDHALMLFRGGVRRALFDLRRDPRQLTNVIEEQADVAEQLLDAFRRFADTQTRKPLDFIEPGAKAAQVQARPRVKISDETKRELRALGYLQ